MVGCHIKFLESFELVWLITMNSQNSLNLQLPFEHFLIYSWIFVLKIILKLQIEYISKGVSQNCSTALNKHLSEVQVRHCSATTVRDMTLIFSSTCRSSRGDPNCSRNLYTTFSFFCRRIWSWHFWHFLFFKFMLYSLQKQGFLFLQ